MGVNNRARRASKRRKQQRSHGHGHAGQSAGSKGSADPRYDGPTPADVKRLVVEVTASALRRNWSPSDLVEVTRRKLSSRHVDLVTRLTAGGGSDQLVDLWGPADIELAVDVSIFFQTLPTIPDVSRLLTTAARDGEAGAPSAMLAKVRALLAKAESTEFPAEAEALSAKAQELIATYALERYAAQLDDHAPDPTMTVRRMWIDAPYVDAKAMLVDAVAGANHCRAVLTAALGFVTLIGQAADIEATELLVTSLQVQSDRAIFLLARADDGPDGSRTRAFRRSFFVAYASRIRERLQYAADEVVAASGQSAALVPVIARNDERVREVTAALFPEITMRRTRISSRAGWVAGRAAADLAQFDVRDQLCEEAAG